MFTECITFSPQINRDKQKKSYIFNRKKTQKQPCSESYFLTSRYFFAHRIFNFHDWHVLCSMGTCTQNLIRGRVLL